MAFGFARDLYGRLSSDLKERMAAPKEGGGFFYPLDPEDAEVDAGAAKQYRREREQYLKFDLEPSEYADLQLKKILVLEHHGLQIVKMKKRFGGTVYYRDRADKDKGDNLLFLPRYKSQQVTRV